MSFQKDYEHWRNNRGRFKGIHPDHQNQKWEVSVISEGLRFVGSAQSLKQAKQAVNAFRQSAGER